MSKIIVRATYDFARNFVIKRDGLALNVSSATIKASLKNQAKTVALIASTAQSNTGGADWATGALILRFSGVQTTGLSAQDGFIEVSILLAGERLPVEDIPVIIETGVITT